MLQGQLDNLLIQSASNQVLCVIATQSGLESCIIGSDRQRNLTQLPQSTASTAVKAVIGAVWRDSDKNFDVVGHVLRRLRYEIFEVLKTHVKMLIVSHSVL